jgi:predicted thioesterase
VEVEQAFEIGMRSEQTFTVEEKYTAGHVGSGSLRVLATPSMIAFMERVASQFMQQRLPEGMSSVGVHVDVHHLAATPLGRQVRVSCEVTGLDGRRVDFRVEAWDDVEKVGEGSHQRYVIEVERFLKRLEAKLPKAGS